MTLASEYHRIAERQVRNRPCDELQRMLAAFDGEPDPATPLHALWLEVQWGLVNCDQKRTRREKLAQAAEDVRGILRAAGVREVPDYGRR